MGVNLKDIISHESIDFDVLKSKVIAVDALNSLYQFLASIRQPDGTPLKNSRGEVTSHLTGLLYRTSRLLKLGIKPVYVFDGKPPELKGREIERRKSAKDKALVEWEKAKREGRIDDALKYAKRTSRLTDEMVEDSKKLLECMGVPCVQAPGEGEAQCAFMCLKGEAWAVGSQDYDSLLFGAPRLVRGLTLSGKLELNIIRLNSALEELGLSREQLIDVAILVGTDFNEGVRGIGPKKGLKIIKEDRFNEIQVEFDVNKVREVFQNPPTTEDYEICWGKPDLDRMVEFLAGEHDFSEERVRKAAKDITDALGDLTQQDLTRWF